ncbi:MAG: DUF4156 domain-containing protein [gamma proteobacterium symbiont of Lucinoma myriamae]|nr:DUF4156 domain-containing protein [gamma proteobacterium symbiont of Lucinoma myriamae]MCU7832639.1 DUF4156 domain-containing protein [gamma proteobacterium symbiont of Lucinoma myriamae]
MKHILYLITIISLTACSEIPLQSGAEKVRLTRQEPKNCEFLGDVTGSQGNAFTGELTSNSTMETGARNDIKNKARTLGGNVVYLLSHRAGQTSDFGSVGNSFYGSSYQSNVTLSGNVYKCPQ